MYGVVEISSKASKETNVRHPVSLAKEKSPSTVCDVVEVCSKALKPVGLHQDAGILNALCLNMS